MTSSPEVDDVVSLLDRCQLPTADITPDLVKRFIGVRDQHRLIGCIGYEKFDRRGLLRSLAVDHSARSSGLGADLVAALETRASNDGIETLYLLTTDAGHYFAKRGYTVLSREQTPEDIRSTRQFSSLCPDSATVMTKSL